MKNKKILLLVGIIVVLLLAVLGYFFLNMNTEKNEINYNNYKGYWYRNEEVSITEYVLVEYDEIVIKETNDNQIVFDYTMAFLCDDTDVVATMNGNLGEFENDESKGTIKFEDDKIILNVKNIYYEETLEKTFDYKTLEKEYNIETDNNIDNNIDNTLE